MKTAVRLVLVAVLGVILTFIMLALLGKNKVSLDIPSSSSNAAFAAEYRITGSAILVDLTYENENGSSEQHAKVKVPFSLKFEATEGQFLYIAAQNDGKSGSVKCEILLDGIVQKEAESTGAYTIATCSGRFKH